MSLPKSCAIGGWRERGGMSLGFARSRVLEHPGLVPKQPHWGPGHYREFPGDSWLLSTVFARSWDMRPGKHLRCVRSLLPSHGLLGREGLREEGREQILLEKSVGAKWILSTLFIASWLLRGQSLQLLSLKECYIYFISSNQKIE